MSEKQTIVTDQSMTRELLAAGKVLGTPLHLDSFHQQAVIVPDGYKIETLPFSPFPPVAPFVDQNVQLNDTESFVAYVKRYQTPDTLLFATLPQNADGSGAEFRAVFDYHRGGKGNLPESGEHPSARCAHQAVYPCPLSESWKNWTRQNGKPQSQVDFINFIEANAIDIEAPDAATIMEMTVNFESHTEVTFQSKIDRLSGAKVLNFSEEVSGGAKSPGKLKVPESLKLRLPIFDNGKSFEITARLEWRPAGGKLAVTYHLQRQANVIREALKTVREEIGKDTGIVPLIGKLG